MKIKFVILVALLIILMTIFNAISSKDTNELFKPLEMEIGEEFINIKYNKPMYVLNYGISDVTGDSENDMVIVIGEAPSASGELLSNNMDVVVYNTANNTFTKTDLKKCNASSPKLMFGDLDGDSINDIILVTDNEDTTKSIRVITMKENYCKEIFGRKDNKELEISGYFIDGFKAYISFKRAKFETNIDLNNKKGNYITSGFYNDEGKVLTTENQITTSGFVTIELVELNGKNGVKVTERVKGFDNLDILDQVQILLKYENGSWQVKEAKGEILGNLLY